MMKNDGKNAAAMRQLLGESIANISDERLEEDFHVISLFINEFIASEEEKISIIDQRGNISGKEIPEAVAVFADLCEAFYRDECKVTAQRVLDNIARVREAVAA